MALQMLYELECDENSGVCEQSSLRYYSVPVLYRKAEEEGWVVEPASVANGWHARHTCPSCLEWLDAGGDSLTRAAPLFELGEPAGEVSTAPIRLTPPAAPAQPVVQPRVRSRVLVSTSGVTQNLELE